MSKRNKKNTKKSPNHPVNLWVNPVYNQSRPCCFTQFGLFDTDTKPPDIDSTNDKFRLLSSS